MDNGWMDYDEMTSCEVKSRFPLHTTFITSPSSRSQPQKQRWAKAKLYPRKSSAELPHTKGQTNESSRTHRGRGRKRTRRGTPPRVKTDRTRAGPGGDSKSGKGGAWTIYPLSPNGQRMDGLRCDDIVRGEIKISPPHNLHHISIIQKPTPKAALGQGKTLSANCNPRNCPIPKDKPMSQPGLTADAEK